MLSLKTKGWNIKVPKVKILAFSIAIEFKPTVFKNILNV